MSSAVKGDPGGNFYVLRKGRLLRDFDQFARAVRPVLVDRYGTAAAAEIVHEARQAFEALLPQIPYIGGSKNPLTRNLVGATRSLALYKALRTRQPGVDSIGRLYNQMMETYLSSSAGWLFRLMRPALSTRLGQSWFKRALKRMAADSHRHRYPDSFVLEYVEGKPGEFDFGIEYTECAIVKFFRSQGADEFTPYLCLFDYPKSRLAGTGLVRTVTLSEGEKKCDFRFRIGQEPENRQKTRIETAP
ncbi:MAG: L-2-amino-thiazoline-4-carboxylic acid hydrolase [Anaerolineales bacterium]|nr:L-2-amino-thiazoline-4-carboxylic acid hydrolase [Anaerolineales bacterium]